MILDEGHALGRSTQTNRLALLSAIRAERRWVMTGTPAPHTAQSRVTPLLPLLAFLRCQPYHGSRGSLAFDAAIRTPFESGRAEGVPPRPSFFFLDSGSSPWIQDLLLCTLIELPLFGSPHSSAQGSSSNSAELEVRVTLVQVMH